MAHGNIGNKNAVGNRGGGRKTAVQERKDNEFFSAIWNGEFSEAKLKKIIKSRKYGSKHIFAAQCMTGNPMALNKLVDKLYSNRSAVEAGWSSSVDSKDAEEVSLEEKGQIKSALASVGLLPRG